MWQTCEGRRGSSYLKFAFACVAGFLLLGVLYFASPLRDMLSLTTKEANLSLSLLSKKASSEEESLPNQNAAIQEPLQTATEEQKLLPPAFLPVHDEMEPSPTEKDTEIKQSPLPVKTVSPAKTSFPVTRIAKGETPYLH